MNRPLFLSAMALGLVACADRPPTANVVADASLASAKPGPGAGGNPHFLYVDYDATLTTLEVDFKQAGLGDFQSVAYVLSAAGAAVRYFCLNNNESGPSPNATPHNGTVGALVATGSFPVRGGSVTGHLELGLPANAVSCKAGGLHPYVERVTFLGVRFRWGDLQIDGPVPPSGNAGPSDVFGPGTWSF